jgi:hypothetical protein
VVVHRGGFRAGRNHLNCGIVGTFMRGGGIGATFLAFPIPLGSTNILFNAPNAAAFGRPPPKCPVAAEPAPCANEAAGEAKTTKNAKATFTEVLDMGKLHYDSLERRMFRGRLCTQPTARSMVVIMLISRGDYEIAS